MSGTDQYGYEIEFTSKPTFPWRWTVYLNGVPIIEYPALEYPSLQYTGIARTEKQANKLAAKYIWQYRENRGRKYMVTFDG